jgi:hypothetical protein
MWKTNSEIRQSAWLTCIGLCAAILLACPGTAGAQGGSFIENWAHTWGGSGDDEISGVAVDTSGNIYLAGYTSSFGAGGYDVLLLKYSPTGALVCRQTWGGSNNDWGRDVALDSSGRFVYVAGGTESSASGNTDVLLVKFDSNCDFVWAQSWDFGGRERAYRVRVDPIDGNIVLGGATGVGTSDDHALLMKVSDPGSTPPEAPLWATNWDIYFTGVNDFSFGVRGGTYACGQTIPPASNGIDAYLAYYDSNGNLRWLTTWNRDVNDSASSCTSDSEGNVYIGGSSGEWVGWGQHAAYLLKFTPSGVLQWANTWGTGRNDQVVRVVTDTNGNVFVAGFTNGLDGTQEDVMLLKYDASGKLLESKIRRGNSDSAAFSAVSALGAIFLAGTAFNSGGSWREFAGTLGTGPVTATLRSVSSVSISLTPTNVVGTTSAPTGVKDTGGGGADAFVAEVNLPPLVRFALKGTSGSLDRGLNPYTAPVISVFDHSMRDQNGDYHVYGCDGRVEAFTTELGTGSPPSPCTGAPGYQNSTHTAFGVNGHYVGDSADGALAAKKLNYDGHPGFDYKADRDTYVYAVADGEIIYPSFIPALGYTAPGYHVMGLRLAHAPDLLVCYLHLSTYCANRGCPKRSYADPTPGCPSPVQLPYESGTRVKAGCLVALSGDAVPGNQPKVAPHLHLEVEKLPKRVPGVLATSNDFLLCDLGGSSVPCIPVDPYGWAGEACEQDPCSLISGVSSTQLWGFQPYLSATALSFGGQAVGAAAAPRSIRLTNVAATVLQISSFELKGPNQADFAQTNDCGTGLLPGGFCTLTVTFSPGPGALGARSAILILTGTDGGTPSAVSLTVKLTGTAM